MDKDSVMFEKYLIAQIKYINDAKWYEGIHICHDPGEQFVECWVMKNANMFRERWNNCMCCSCEKADKCGDLLKEGCTEFKDI